jgi:hypothetical protein
MRLIDTLLPSKSTPTKCAVIFTVSSLVWMIIAFIFFLSTIALSYQCRIAQEHARIAQDALTNVVYMPRAAFPAPMPPPKLHRP